MAVYLRGIDPAGHIIHTNFGNMDGYRQIDGMPEMEVVSTKHLLPAGDMAQTGIWGTQYMMPRYQKPFILTEYGVGHRGGWIDEDPAGVIVHNGLWGPLTNGSAATGMPLGLEQLDRSAGYVSLLEAGCSAGGRRSVLAAAMETGRGRPVSPSATAGTHPIMPTCFVEGWPRNLRVYASARKERPEVFRIDAEGQVPKEESLSATLRAGEQCTFAVEFPVDGAFVVHVPEIS